MSVRFSAICVATLVAAASSMATAQSICVDCAEPDRNYRCAIKDAERVQSVRGATRGLEFICISEIARLNGHRTCRVNTTFAGPCIGQLHEIDLTRSGGADTAATPKPGDPVEAGKDGATAPAPATPAAAPARKGPPQTVEELAKETVAKSKEQFSAVDEKVRQAGGAIGDAMKKSWNCVSSLFSKC